MKPPRLLLWAGLYGGSGVIFGAFGAHALAARLAEDGMASAWETAVAYQMWHALALLGLAALHKDISAGPSATAWILGVLLFSGSLYGLALGGPPWLGPVTPLGGLLLIAGWAGVVVKALRLRTAQA